MEQAQYDAIKDNWGEVEDRDGVRLSWNTIPSTRMVSRAQTVLTKLNILSGSKPPRCTVKLLVDTAQGRSWRFKKHSWV